MAEKFAGWSLIPWYAHIFGKAELQADKMPITALGPIYA